MYIESDIQVPEVYAFSYFTHNKFFVTHKITYVIIARAESAYVQSMKFITILFISLSTGTFFYSMLAFGYQRVCFFFFALEPGLVICTSR